jgi:hypothetical protein
MSKRKTSKAEVLVADNDDATEWCHENGAHVMFSKDGCVVSTPLILMRAGQVQTANSLVLAVREIQKARNQERQ